jgi:hypothetical protein
LIRDLRSGPSESSHSKSWDMEVSCCFEEKRKGLSYSCSRSRDEDICRRRESILLISWLWLYDSSFLRRLFHSSRELVGSKMSGIIGELFGPENSLLSFHPKLFLREKIAMVGLILPIRAKYSVECSAAVLSIFIASEKSLSDPSHISCSAT